MKGTCLQTGDKKGHLTFVKEAETRILEDGKKYRFITVKCDCGVVKEVRKASFVSGRLRYCDKDCGIKKDAKQQCIGQKFGRYTVHSFIRVDDTKKGTCVKVTCQCGTERTVQLSLLKKGYVKQCHRCASNQKQKQVSVGTTFDKLTVEKLYRNEDGVPYVTCRCECGNEKTTKLYYLTRKKKKESDVHSCGCIHKKQLTGQRFGQLVVQEEAQPYQTVYKGKPVTKRRWVCDCDCGVQGKIVNQNELLQGSTRSCGCLQSSENRSERVKGKNNPMYGRKGEQNPKWDPERTHEQRKKERKDNRYYVWRKKVYERDRYACKCCGDDAGGNLAAHHIYNYADFPDVRYDVSNGITLCSVCHNGFHSIYGKSHNTKEQLEAFFANFSRQEIAVSLDSTLGEKEFVLDGKSRVKPYSVIFPNGEEKQYYTYEDIRNEVGISVCSSLKSVRHQKPYQKRWILAMKNGQEVGRFASCKEAGCCYGCSGSTIAKLFGKTYNEKRFPKLVGVSFQEEVEVFEIRRLG